VPQLNPQHAFPPRFERGIKYPAIYNLDELELTTAPVGNASIGTYFNVTFDGYVENEIPNLTFGKHRFIVRHAIAPADQMYDEEGNSYWDPGAEYPLLRPGSRILFEIKDGNGLVIYSDLIPSKVLSSNDGFEAYAWLKVDPLRTYSFIKEGPGTLTIAGETIVGHNDRIWKGQYNVRTTFPINITLTRPEVDNDGEDITVLEENVTPLTMRYSEYHMGSGSGLFLSESLDNSTDRQRSYLHLSASKLETYGGKISNVDIAIKVKYENEENGEVITSWKTIMSYLPISIYSNTYENYIHSDYSDGLNPISFEVSGSDIPIPPYDGVNPNYRCRFRIRFRDSSTDKAYASDYNNPSNDPCGECGGSIFEMIYPSGSSNINGNWFEWGGTTRSATSTKYSDGDMVLRSTSAGHFIFKVAPHSISGDQGGQTLGIVPGRDSSYGDDDPYNGGQGGSGPVN